MSNLAIVYEKMDKELFWEVAKNYPSKEALRKGNKGAHRAGEREGWLQEFPFKEQHRPNYYWNQERCFKEASKYSTRSEFHHQSEGAYTSALRNGWIEDYTWFIPKSKIRNKCIYISSSFSFNMSSIEISTGTLFFST